MPGASAEREGAAAEGEGASAEREGAAAEGEGATPDGLAADKEELVFFPEEPGFPIYLDSEQIVAGGQVQLSDKVLMGQDGRVARGDIMRIARRAGLVDTMLGGASSICNKAQEILEDWLRCALKDTISRMNSPSHSLKHYITAAEMTQTLRDQGRAPIGWGGRTGPVWSEYIRLVLVQVHPESRLSEISTTVMDDLVCLVLGKVVTEANEMRELSLPPLPPAGILCRDLSTTQVDQLNERFPRIVHEKDSLDKDSLFTRCACGDGPCAAVRAAAIVPVRMAQKSCVITDTKLEFMEASWEDVFDPSHCTQILDIEHLEQSVRAVFPGDLAKHAVSEGTKAVTKFQTACLARSVPRRKTAMPTRTAKAGLQFSVDRTAAATDYMYSTVLTETSAVYMAAVLEYMVAELLELGGNEQRTSRSLGEKFPSAFHSRSDQVAEWNSLCLALCMSEDQREILDAHLEHFPDLVTWSACPVRLASHNIPREYPRREEEEPDDDYNRSRWYTIYAQDIQRAISNDEELFALVGHKELVFRNGLFIRDALWETKKSWMREELAARQEKGDDDDDDNNTRGAFESWMRDKCKESTFPVIDPRNGWHVSSGSCQGIEEPGLLEDVDSLCRVSDWDAASERSAAQRAAAARANLDEHATKLLLESGRSQAEQHSRDNWLRRAESIGTDLMIHVSTFQDLVKTTISECLPDIACEISISSTALQILQSAAEHHLMNIFSGDTNLRGAEKLPGAPPELSKDEELFLLRQRPEWSPSLLHRRYQAVRATRIGVEKKGAFLPPGVAPLVACLSEIASANWCSTMIGQCESQENLGAQGEDVAQEQASVGGNAAFILCDASRNYLFEAQDKVRKLTTCSTDDDESSTATMACRNDARQKHCAQLQAAALIVMNNTETCTSAASKLAEHISSLSLISSSEYFLAGQNDEQQTPSSAVQSFELWLSKYQHNEVSKGSDEAVQAVRVAMQNTNLLGMDDAEGCEEDANQLDGLLLAAGKQLEAEVAFWKESDPLAMLPTAKLVAAAEQALSWMQSMHSLLMELQDIQQHLNDPSDLVGELKLARRSLSKAKRSLRRCQDDVEACQEEIADGNLDNDSQELEEAQQSCSEAKAQVRLADQAIHVVVLSLAAQERHWPEVGRELGNNGVPSELMSLWRAEREPNYYTSYKVLEEAQTRPQNAVMMATLDGAVTVVKEFQAGNEVAMRTCMREARLLRRLRHPAVVEILSLFQYTHPGGRVAFCMEMPWYEQGQLDHWVAREKPDARAIRGVMHQVLGALAHLHNHHVVHRDVKPPNILIDLSGRPKLADFDISVESSERTTVMYTRGQTTLAMEGTEGFMAPELKTDQASPASDMYSFGKSLAVITTSGVDSDLDSAVVKLTSESPAQRPTADQAAFLPYFEKVWNWESEERRSCCIMASDTCDYGSAEVLLQHGIECTNRDKTHFVCDGCLVDYVKSESTMELRVLASRDARIFCPMHRGAGKLGCESCEYSDDDLAMHLRRAPGIFSLYITARQQLLEQRIAQEADERIQAELERLTALDEQERKVLHARHHITDNIINCKCPRCHQVFVDFTNCFALQCARCPCGFCAWCLADCGEDAHAHIRNCAHKPVGSDIYYGSVEQFEVAQNKRRHRELSAYLKTLDPVTRRDTLECCMPEFASVGLQVSDI